MQKAQQAFLSGHRIGMDIGEGQSNGSSSVIMSMASGGAGADDGWLEGFLAHGQLAEAARGVFLQ
jgi:hypothetical protein